MFRKSYALRTLRPQDTSSPRHFGTYIWCRSVSDTSAPVPKCLKTLRHRYETSQDTSGRCGRPTAGESDSDVSMRTHVSRTVSSCFAILRQLRSIRRSTWRRYNADTTWFVCRVRQRRPRHATEAAAKVLRSWRAGAELVHLIFQYLCGRVQHVRTSAACSTSSAVLYGVQQGSVLGSILFLLYTADLLQLVKRH